jgi:hypothetical protein
VNSLRTDQEFLSEVTALTGKSSTVGKAEENKKTVNYHDEDDEIPF